MTITTRVISGYFYLPDGSVPVNGRIAFTLTGYDAEGNDGIAPETVEFTINESTGLFSDALWVSEEGTAGRTYLVEARYWSPEVRAAVVKPLGTIYVTAGAGGLVLNDLLAIPTPAPVTADVLALITAMRDEVEVDRAAAAASATAADISADQAALYEGVWLDDVAAVVADTALTYSAGAGQVTVGQYVRTREESFSYEVAASAATDHHLQTSHGTPVKLYAKATSAGPFNFREADPAADGVTDDWPKLEKMLAIRMPNPSYSGSIYYPQGPTIFFPSGNYYFNPGANGVQLKAVTRLLGEASGVGNVRSGSRLHFAPNCPGIVINTHNTLNGGTEGTPTGGADGSEISNLVISSTLGSNPDAHGLWARARFKGMNLLLDQFTGDGVHIRAGAGTGGSDEGNANNWMLSRIRSIRNAGNGYYVQGADVNAGYAEMCDATANGRSGILDNSFLGNTWVGCHTDSNGMALLGSNAADESAFVTYGGNRYAAHWNATEAQLVATTPGTDPTVWILDGAGGTHTYIPLWTAGKPVGTYFKAFPYYSVNANARNTFIGCYTESGQPKAVLLTPSLAVGGLIDLYTGAHLRTVFDNIVTKSGGVGVSNETLEMIVGPAGESAVGTLLRWEAAEETGLPWRWQYNATNNNYQLQNGNLDNRVAMMLTSGDTTTTMGTSGAVPYICTFPTIGIGSGATLRRRTVGAAAPTTGAWAKGDRVDNYDPGASSVKYWLCTVAGTPGTWTAFGAQAAARADVSGAATLADLITAFNDLLAKMRTANQLAP